MDILEGPDLGHSTKFITKGDRKEEEIGPAPCGNRTHVLMILFAP